MTSKSFKTRFNQHRHTFRTETRKNDTALAQYIWAKNLGPNPDIEWCILKKCKVIKPGDKLCDLCVSEKVYISARHKTTLITSIREMMWAPDVAMKKT